MEQLNSRAADAIKKIDGLLEKIPAGGEDVTRRTVLQQRLRGHFALVQKTHREMAGTLSDLQPSVNFRLDAALSAVAGLGRQLEMRRKALIVQIQEQDSRQRKVDYDRKVHDARAQLDDLNLHRDRVLADLTAASDRMRAAEPGRTQLIQAQGQLADVDGQIEELTDTLSAAHKRADNLQATSTQPAAIALKGPVIDRPAVNSRSRTVLAGASGLMAFGIVLAGWLVMLPAGVTGKKP